MKPIWVFQLSILTFILGLLRTPYNAAIIAHERMSFYAFVSIIEVYIKTSHRLFAHILVFKQINYVCTTCRMCCIFN